MDLGSFHIMESSNFYILFARFYFSFFSFLPANKNRKFTVHRVDVKWCADLLDRQFERNHAFFLFDNMRADDGSGWATSWNAASFGKRNLRKR